MKKLLAAVFVALFGTVSVGMTFVSGVAQAAEKKDEKKDEKKKAAEKK